MGTDGFTLQSPHVHDWRRGNGDQYLGLLDDATEPIRCGCGQAAGDWSKVGISVDFSGTAELAVSELWPDGDHPVPITVEAVRRVMENDGSKAMVLADWSLIDALTVTVTVGSVGLGTDSGEVWKRR